MRFYLYVLRSPSCRAGRDVIPDSLRTYRARGQGVRVSSDLCDVGTMERTTIVKEREKNAACCMLRDAKHRTTLMRSDFVCNRILSLRSLSHKLESLQASYPHMSVQRRLCRGVKRGFARSSAFLASFGGDLFRRSGESFWARALPPMRANSVTVSGFFFMDAI